MVKKELKHSTSRTICSSVVGKLTQATNLPSLDIQVTAAFEVSDPLLSGWTRNVTSVANSWSSLSPPHRLHPEGLSNRSESQTVGAVRARRSGSGQACLAGSYYQGDKRFSLPPPLSTSPCPSPSFSPLSLALSEMNVRLRERALVLSVSLSLSISIKLSPTANKHRLHQRSHHIYV